MKFSKSGILTLSGMLIANSFLLMATAYATENGKSIITKPDNARQSIEEIILSNGAEKKICTIILFDKSGSMFDEVIDGVKKRLYYDDTKKNPKPGKKWNNAVNGTIEYSELLLEKYPTAKIGLVLFGTNAVLTKGLSNKTFKNEDFKVPTDDEWTRLDLGIEKARKEFKNQKEGECTVKNIIIISDGEPQGSSISKETASKLAFKETIGGKEEGINFYSIGYEVGNFGKEVLRGVSAGGFYDTESTNIKTIFKAMSEDQRNGSSMKSDNNKLKIITDNLILTQSGNTEYTNKISDNSKYSNILGGKGNNISAGSSMSCIIAGKTNSIQTSDGSTILGGKENQINQGKPTSDSIGGKSTIIGGYKNVIQQGSFSTIGGGSGNNIEESNYSTIIGNNSKIIGGDYSIAMGSNTKNHGKNSFYRTDGINREQLNQDNVFAIVSEKGMAVNTNNPHVAAKLTISGNLSITPNDNDENIVCGDGTGKGIIKAVKKNNNDECLCSCNGTKRESLYNGACESICNNEIAPTCGSSVTFNDSKYHGTCSSGTPIDTSYYVTKENIIHRTCQTHDGNIANCTGTLNQ